MFNDLQEMIVSCGIYPGVTVAVTKNELDDYMTMRMRMTELHALTVMMGDDGFDRINPKVKNAIVGLAEGVAAEMKQLLSAALARRA